jgi:hypothetical protein
MCKKFLSLTLIALLINVFGMTPVRAGAQVVKLTPNVERVKENVRKLGTGEAARVELKLWDGTKLKGSIREARKDDFIIADAKTGAATTLTYAQVKQLKGSNNLTAPKDGLTIARGVAIFSAVALAAMLLALVSVPKT